MKEDEKLEKIKPSVVLKLDLALIRPNLGHAEFAGKMLVSKLNFNFINVFGCPKLIMCLFICHIYLVYLFFKVHQAGHHYCQACAYKKAICSMCGKKLLETKNYKQSSA